MSQSEAEAIPFESTHYFGQYRWAVGDTRYYGRVYPSISAVIKEHDCQFPMRCPLVSVWSINASRGVMLAKGEEDVAAMMEDYK